MQKKQCLLRVLVSRCEAQWVSHCLDLDLVSEGATLRDAVDAVVEAIDMVVREDVQQGLDPLDRKRAPREFWDRWFEVMTTGVPLDPSRGERDVSELATLVKVVRDLHPALDQELHDGFELLPEAWQIATLERLRESGCARRG